MNDAWLLVSAFMVFLMQAGFLCLETGKVRSKNSINVAAKNISDFVLSTIVFWLFGFALMFGDSYQGWFGTSHFLFGDNQSASQISFFVFQLMFCGTAATLLSGAVAERMSFFGYLWVTVIMASVIYPITGHWAWASTFNSNGQGWLEELGFIDFAGSTVVHSVGGSVALVAVLCIGPRIGRFDTKYDFPTGSNIPLAVMGTLFLWLGWIGFNGGSTLEYNDRVPVIVLNTFVAAVFGGLVGALCHYLRHRFVDVTYILNGVLAGLVAITASCFAVSPKSAMLIGATAGVIFYVGTAVLERLKIDDALGVVPVHLFAGIWGTLALALFADLSLLGTGLDRLQQLSVQALGVVSLNGYALLMSLVLLKGLARFVPLRVTQQQELQGMNISEHQASTELIDLLDSMQQQQADGQFSSKVPVEPFTEVGQIAHQYNKVIQRVHREIDQRDGAIQRFRTSEKRKSAILDASMDSIVSIDLNGKIIEFNPAAEKTFGFLKSDVLNKNFIGLFVPEEDRANALASLEYKFSASHGLVYGRRNVCFLLRSSQERFPAEVTVTGANFGSELRNEYTLYIRDTTQQTKLQKRLNQLAYSDPLTGLHNRTYFMNTLNKKLALAKPGELAVFFMDLDHFKNINDTLGHAAGDRLLREVASRLSQAADIKDMVSRWGGDEFVLLFHTPNTLEWLDAKAQQILGKMREPLMLEGREVTIQTSIGVSIFQPEQDSAALIQQADVAMYHAKQSGRDNYQVFNADMMRNSVRKFNFNQEMKKALQSDDQLQIVYQPKVNSRAEVVGLEALLRWYHPTGGFISPAEFIPLAEESSLIVDIDRKVIDLVFKQMSQWQREGLPLTPVSINLSGKHLLSADLLSFVATKLANYRLEGRHIEFEITEGVLVTDIERCIAALSELKKLDITLSIDDFGTGYSSLNYLKRLPLDVLKIDRSFVDECATNAEDGQICATIINLAQNLELKTVAEGVETEQQLTFLMERGCKTFQGYHFYRAMSADKIRQLLAD